MKISTKGRYALRLLLDLGEHRGDGFVSLKEIYTVGEILRLTEGSLAPVACLEQEPNLCERQESCATLPVWQGLYRVIIDYLDHITLQDILDQEHEKGGDYVI